MKRDSSRASSWASPRSPRLRSGRTGYMRSKDGVDSPPLAEVQLPSAPPLMPPPLTSVRIRPGYWYLVTSWQDANELVARYGKWQQTAAAESQNNSMLADPQPQLGRQLALVLEPVAERVVRFSSPPSAFS